MGSLSKPGGYPSWNLNAPDDKLDPDIFEASQEISEADINKVWFKKGVVVNPLVSPSD